MHVDANRDPADVWKTVLDLFDKLIVEKFNADLRQYNDHSDVHLAATADAAPTFNDPRPHVDSRRVLLETLQTIASYQQRYAAYSVSAYPQQVDPNKRNVGHDFESDAKRRQVELRELMEERKQLTSKLTEFAHPSAFPDSECRPPSMIDDRLELAYIASYAALLPRFERDVASTQDKYVRAWKRVFRDRVRARVHRKHQMQQMSANRLYNKGAGYEEVIEDRRAAARSNQPNSRPNLQIGALEGEQRTFSCSPEE